MLTPEKIESATGFVNPYLGRAAANDKMLVQDRPRGRIDTIDDEVNSLQDSLREDSEIGRTITRSNNKPLESSILHQNEGEAPTKLGLLANQSNTNSRPSTNPNDSQFQVLGMISHNKELFLFERAVKMIGGVEEWLVKVEEGMQETVAKMINYAVSSFPNQSLDEWILDYP